MDLIFIHGPAAAGKLTIGRELAALTGFPLFHNHLVVDAVGAVFPFGSEAFIRLRHQFWLEVFGEAAQARRSLIFTFAPEPTVPVSFPDDAAAAVSRHGGVVRFVRLLVSNEGQERRVTDESRAAFHKLRSVEVLRAIRARGGAVPLDRAELTLDTEQLGPAEAARRIVETLGLEPLAEPYSMFPTA